MVLEACRLMNDRLTTEVVDERFGPNKIIKRDMLGSFLAHGLTQDQAKSEALVQMYASFCTS